MGNALRNSFRVLFREQFHIIRLALKLYFS